MPSLVVNEADFRVVLAIVLTFQILSGILDVKSEFFPGEFENDKKICMEAQEDIEFLSY